MSSVSELSEDTRTCLSETSSVGKLSTERIERALSDYDTNHAEIEANKPLRAISCGKHRRASVLVPLIERGGEFNVILTKRSPNLKHHAGQISFPGGKVDTGDENSLATALREAKEEVGIEPTQVRILGNCPVQFLPAGFVVTPHVGVIMRPYSVVVQAEEVEEIFEIRLEYIADMNNYSIDSYKFRDIRRYFHVLAHPRYYIWGATAGILYGFAKQLELSCS